MEEWKATDGAATWARVEESLAAASAARERAAARADDVNACKRDIDRHSALGDANGTQRAKGAYRDAFQRFQQSKRELAYVKAACDELQRAAADEAAAWEKATKRS
jgi:hypothetical protein